MGEGKEEEGGGRRAGFEMVKKERERQRPREREREREKEEGRGEEGPWVVCYQTFQRPAPTRSSPGIFPYPDRCCKQDEPTKCVCVDIGLCVCGCMNVHKRGRTIFDSFPSYCSIQNRFRHFSNQ